MEGRYYVPARSFSLKAIIAQSSEGMPEKKYRGTSFQKLR